MSSVTDTGERSALAFVCAMMWSTTAELSFLSDAGGLRNHKPMSLAMIIFITSLVPP